MKNREGVDVALLCLRLALGAIFIAHGAQKLFPVWGGPGIDDFAVKLAAMGIHPERLMAYVAAATELGGGILVAIGLFSRIAALGLAGVMVVGIVKVHLRNGFFGPAGFEYPMALLAMSLAIVIAGGGGIGVPRPASGGAPKKAP